MTKNMTLQVIKAMSSQELLDHLEAEEAKLSPKGRAELAEALRPFLELKASVDRKNAQIEKEEKGQMEERLSKLITEAVQREEFEKEAFEKVFELQEGYHGTRIPIYNNYDDSSEQAREQFFLRPEERPHKKYVIHNWIILGDQTAALVAKDKDFLFLSAVEDFHSDHIRAPFLFARGNRLYRCSDQGVDCIYKGERVHFSSKEILQRRDLFLFFTPMKGERG